MAQVKQSVIEDSNFRKSNMKVNIETFKVGDKVIVTGRNYHNLKDQCEGIVVSSRVFTVDIEGPSNGKLFPEDKSIIQTILPEHLTINNQVNNLNLNTMTTQERKDAIEKVANELMTRDGNITTLFIKNELHKQYPNIFWTRYHNNGIPGVSDLFHDLVREGKFVSVADNGTYQTYEPVNYRKNQAKNTSKLTTALKSASAASTNPTVTKASRGLKAGSPTALAAGKKAAATRAANKGGNVVTGNRIGKAKARDMILNAKGILSVTYIKKDGTERTLAGVVVKNQTDLGLGYILMKDLVKTKAEGKEVIRRANIQTTKSFKTKGQTYKVA